ncbi:MAG: hypothetical protein JW941_08025 [Candidatus Coatesbacteria bacterium]|nr:hypothetical protein [Candidatus Coatesbacteria bacterium]
MEDVDDSDKGLKDLKALDVMKQVFEAVICVEGSQQDVEEGREAPNWGSAHLMKVPHSLAPTRKRALRSRWSELL